MNHLWTILAVKALDEAKARLAPAVDPAGRRDIAHRLVVRTFEVVSAARLEAVAVVTNDSLVAALAAGHGFAILADPGGGQSGAVAEGARWARDHGAEAVATVATDLPLLGSAEVRSLVGLAAPRRLVIAPDRAGQGTNAIVVAPPDFPFAFGPGSLRRHLDSAADLGLEVVFARAAGLATDLDYPDDVGLLDPR